MQHVYETSTDPVVQQSALRLLARFENPTLAQRAFDYAISPKVRNQDSAIQLAIALGHTATRDQTWGLIKRNWDKVQAQFTTAMGSYVVSGTSSFCSVAARDDVEEFFADHKVAASSTTLKHAIERINGCIELQKQQEPNLEKWLAAQPKS
jgi:aminopeptidase N/puromycin-sensitive aminopeptidase